MGRGVGRSGNLAKTLHFGNEGCKLNPAYAEAFSDSFFFNVRKLTILHCCIS